MRIEVENPEQVVKRAFWLAWQACGSTAGAGWIQDRPGADEDAVWNNIRTRGDYPGPARDKPGEASADYVFGRMMKTFIRWDKNSVEVFEATPRRDYQAWAGRYPTYQALIEAAVKSLAPAEVQPA